ncbi:sulfur carrier protein ThiS [Candidatus Riflebacteria bacterium]
MIYVNETSIQWREKMTVSDALAAMQYDYTLITVTVNGQYVPNKEFEYFHIPDEAEVKAIHICHGG